MWGRPKDQTSDMWWALVVTGAASILFGIATLFMPGLTLALLIIFFALFIVVMGVIEIIQGLSEIRTNDQWWLSAGIGLLFLGLGVYLTRHLGITAVTFVLLIGWTLLIRGIFDVAVGLTVHRNTDTRIFRVITGALGIIAGIIIWVHPASGSLAFTWALGLYALVAGCLMLGEALVVRSLADDSRKK